MLDMGVQETRFYRMGCVYLAKNKINGKCYVGKTIGTLKRRKNAHYTDARRNSNFNEYFHNALLKYKKEFEWIVLYKSTDNKKLIEKEMQFIKKYKTLKPNGYNLTNGGDGMVGYVFSEESKRKMRASHIGKIQPHSEETKRKMRKPKRNRKNYFGRFVSKETRNKISKTLKGHHVSNSTKMKIGLTLKNRKRGKPCNSSRYYKNTIFNT
jgi:group I intron endonuclease